MKKIPRPLGLTFQAIQLRALPEDQSQQKTKEIQKRLVELYVAQGTKINNRTMNIQEFSSYIGLSTIELMKMMNKELERIDGFFDNNGKGSRAQTRALFLGLFFEVQQASQMAQKQATILAKAQGQKYVPFLSSSLNQAIANLSTSFKPSIELVKLLDGTSSNNPNSNGLTTNTQNNHYHITPDKAFEIARKAYQNSTENDAQIDTPSTPFLLPEMEPNLPEVRAQFQDLNSIGIRHDGLKDEA